MVRLPTTKWRPVGRPEHAALPVDFACGWTHFIDHLAPVWKAMRNRGRFCVPDGLADYARACGVDASPMSALPASSGPIAVASYGDLRPLAKAGRHLILFEHGAGFTFGISHPSYAGGLRERAYVSLFACTNDWVERADAAAIPGCRTVVVGCPKLDALTALPAPENPDPVVAVSFHWECRVAPETRSAFPHYRDALPELARRFKVIGHAHPRNAAQMREEFTALGIEFVDDFAEVCKRADVYANDASSTLYEFAALGRPVVVLNAPWYRRKANLGLRFWDCEDVGVCVDEPGDLVAAIEYALADPGSQVRSRELAVDFVYPHIGRAAVKAAEMLDDFPAVLSGRRTPKRVSLPKTKASRGVLYVAIGEQARALAAHSAGTLRAWHEIPVAVVSDGQCDWADTVIDATPHHRAGRWHKVRAYDLSPWDETLYLDADTEVTAPLKHGFAALADGWEMAIAQDCEATFSDRLKRGDPGLRELRRIAALLPTTDLTYWNSGVFFWRKCAAVAELFRRWAEQWHVAEAFDQPPLAAAFYTMPEPPRVWLLSQRYHSHLPDVATAVLHHHHTLQEVPIGRHAS